jgi:hypothetical protein
VMMTAVIVMLCLRVHESLLRLKGNGYSYQPSSRWKVKSKVAAPLCRSRLQPRW